MNYDERMKKAMTYDECIERFLEGFGADVTKEDIHVEFINEKEDIYLEKKGGSAYTETYILNKIDGMYYETEILGIMVCVENEIKNNNLQTAVKFINGINNVLRNKAQNNDAIIDVFNCGSDIVDEVQSQDLKVITDEEIKGYMYYYKNYSEDGKSMYIEKLTRGLVVEVYNNLVYKMRMGYGCIPAYYKY